MSFFDIAGYTIELSGFPESLIWDRFFEFSCGASTPHIAFRLLSGPESEIASIPADAEKLVDAPLYMTYRFGGSTHFFGTPYNIISYTKVNDGYTECIFNIKPDYHDRLDGPEARESIRDTVMMDIRKALTGRLALDRGICIHSSVINFDNDGILFSAVSGTGKSTHARLWQEVFPGTEIINGDNGFCRVLDVAAYVFGAPWCGNSNEYLNKRLPIKAFVFLERATENSIEKLNVSDAFIRLSARCYMPFWDKALVNRALDTVECITRTIDCFLLRCLPDCDSVKVAEREIFRSKR